MRDARSVDTVTASQRDDSPCIPGTANAQTATEANGRAEAARGSPNIVATQGFPDYDQLDNFDTAIQNVTTTQDKHIAKGKGLRTQLSAQTFLRRL